LQAVESEKALLGNIPDEAVIAQAAKLAASAASPSADRRGSTEYKREMVRVLCGRALAAALERAGRA
jgi:carbon-monoxide dehydrogenase medium subunit